MASTQVTTTSQPTTITHGRCLERAGSRLWAAVNNGTDLVLYYSDDDGVSWSSPITVASGSSLRASVVYDTVNSRLNVAYAGSNDATDNIGLKMRAVTTNAATGTPGALTTETVIDAGGTNAGVQYIHMVHSPTASNARYWIIGQKTTAASTYETRVWLCAAGSAADTAGNWSTTNFTNLGANSNGSGGHSGIGCYWKVSGADRVTFIFGSAEGTQDYEAVTFDPSAATPTPGTVTVDIAAGAIPEFFGNGALIAAAAKDDYLVFGRFDNGAATWSFYKTVDGVSYSTPSGWGGLTMGRCQIAKSGGDFYLLHTDSYGAIGSSAQTLRYRKLTAAGDNMGGTTVFSDNAGNGVTVPADTGTSKLYGLYRGSTADPYTVRSDSVSTGAGGDVTPPGQAQVTVAVATSTRLDVTSVMPSDSDVAQYEVRFLAGATAPAANRTDGTVAAGPAAASPNQTIVTQVTGLTAGTRYTFRVFVKDTAGNWNTGATGTAVPVTTPTFVRRLRADGVTEVPDATSPRTDILEYQLAPTDFQTGGANGHLRLRVGYDAVTPPSQNTYDVVSTSGTAFEYKDAGGVWQAWPSAGVPSTEWGRLIRVHVDTPDPSQFASLRVEQ